MRVLKVFWIFLKLGCTSFGGPIAHLSYFREAFVVKYKWLDEKQYAYLVGISQIIPGPASSQVGFGIGLHRAGLLGGIAAFIGFTLPSVVLLLLFASQAFNFGNATIQKIVSGLTIIAFVVVFQAVVGMSKQLLIRKQDWFIAIAVAVVVLFTESIWSQVFCILIAAICNLILDNLVNKQGKLKQFPEGIIVDKALGFTSLVLFLLIFLVLFITKIPLLEYARGFYISGALVFGGGHVVVPFLESVAVSKGTLSQDMFLSGYGFTQALPGPMFSFAAYLGYTTQMSAGGTVYSSIFSSITALVFIFLPGFLLLLAAMSFLGSKLKNKQFISALDGANSAVVGVLGATLYDPIFIHAIDSSFSVVVSIVGIIALMKFKFPVLGVIAFTILSSVLFY